MREGVDNGVVQAGDQRVGWVNKGDRSNKVIE